MVDTEKTEWYCFTTLPKKEHIAAANIKSRAALEAFCPRISYRKKTKRGIVKFIEPLFPNYIFVNCEIQQHLRHIMAMQGVRSVVKYGDRIPSLSPAFIAELSQYFIEDVKEVPNPEFKPGEEVIVAEGPFSNLRAIVESYVPATDRIRVLLDFLGRDVSVEFSRDQILLPDYDPKQEIGK